jgi:hypothetical protein
MKPAILHACCSAPESRHHSPARPVTRAQIALPLAECSAVYATSGYSASMSNLSQVSLATDNVFSDGATLETPTISGSVSAGYAIALTVGIAA